MSTYFSIAAPSQGIFEEKGSKFLSFAFPVMNESEIKECLLEIKTQHPKATHHCYAYRVGYDKNNYRANDDGEPSGSAGRPILGQIDSKNLSNVLIIVVRYYGGTKLGVSGLISAYKKASNAVLEAAAVIEKEILARIEIETDYLQINDLLNYLKKSGIEEWEQEYTEACKITFNFPISMEESLSLWLGENDYSFSLKKA